MNARIVFDLDGTLIDSARDIRAIANAALARLGAEPITLEQTHGFIGHGIGDFVARMRAARGIPESEQAGLQADMTARYEGAVTLTTPYRGVPQALDQLAERHRLGICTNKLLRPTMSVLGHLGIAHHFGSIWGGDNPLGRKPDPAALLAAFDDLGEGPRLFVGDSEIDAETAARAGVAFVLFTSGYRRRAVDDIPHAARFDDFADLPPVVERLLADRSDVRKPGVAQTR